MLNLRKNLDKTLEQYKDLCHFLDTKLYELNSSIDLLFANSCEIKDENADIWVDLVALNERVSSLEANTQFFFFYL